MSYHDIAQAVTSLYASLNFSPPPRQYTVLSAFILVDRSHEAVIKIISLATGSKCLPTSRLPKEGDALHDSHAEVLARRGAVRWFLEEIARSDPSADSTPWLKRCKNGLFSLKNEIELVLYISTVPCGDSSTRYLAAFQDPQIAALKNSSEFPALPPSAAARGRDNYFLFGVLRTKPGRADSPPTLSMSCSDKIARWNVLGIQGALASQFLSPTYIDCVLIADIDTEMQPIVREDCERAFSGRLSSMPDELPYPFRLHRPLLNFVAGSFQHSHNRLIAQGAVSSCNNSLCWIADTSKRHEVLINGVKRGVPPKHLHNPKFRPQLSKIALLELCRQTAQHLQVPFSNDTTTYYNLKQRIIDYQNAKFLLQGPGRPFAGWLTSGVEWESFDVTGTPHLSRPTSQQVICARASNI